VASGGNGVTRKVTAVETTGAAEENNEDIGVLIPLARKDKAAAAQLWKLLEAQGNIDSFLHRSDMARHTERSMISAYNGTDVLGREMSERRLEQMRRELAGENSTPLETLLIERIVQCWFHVHQCEITLAQDHSEMTITIAAYHQKRLNSAHKRYLSAIKALAQVRKLQVPTVQVNIGDKQVNIVNEK
jgi:hypothetical protein